MSRVIIFVTDENYIDHVKSVATNCRVQGNYDDDFAIITPRGCWAAKEFEQRGFSVLEVDETGFLQKFFVFDKFFKAWDEALYLDCDILVQDDLERLFHLLEVDDSKIWCDTEDGSTLESMWRDTKKDQHPEVYDLMQKEYPHVNNQTFNTAFILFKPSILPDDVPQQLISVQNKIEPANVQSEGGTDQQVINLLLWNQMKKTPNKLVCFWGLAEPQNDVDSEYRQYKKGDIPVAIHFSRWYAEWIDKATNMDAYWNHLLKRPNYDVYKENLSKFDEMFPTKLAAGAISKQDWLAYLFNHYGSDKEQNHHYTQYYAKHLPEKVNKLMEIGCWKGGGIRALKEYYKSQGEFHTINYIFGGEIISKQELIDLGIKPLEGRQEDLNFLRTIPDLYSVVIDDGSHHSDAQVISFKQMFLNNLESGGLYVIEDVYGHTDDDGAYWRRGVVNSANDTILPVLHRLMNGDMSASHFFSEAENRLIEGLISDMWVYDSKIIFVKKR